MATNANHKTGAGSAASNGQPFLRIQQVVKQFGDAVAVDGVSLDIAKGEIFALLGSSGCGKSTLLRMLAGFETPTSGQILLQGQDLVRLPPNERPVNMMFQSYALFPHMTVWDNVAFGLRRDGLPKDEIAAQVDKMLDKDLDARLTFSGSNGKEQTDSLSTYRDWLQAKGGINTYA